MSATPILGLLQATDRNGATVARLEVRHWPVTVGRALTADLVLDDSHVAGEHLRIRPHARGRRQRAGAGQRQRRGPGPRPPRPRCAIQLA
jgi:hypothetical protein